MTVKRTTGWLAFLDLLGTTQLAENPGIGEDIISRYETLFDKVSVSGDAFAFRGSPVFPMLLKELSNAALKPFSKTMASYIYIFSDSIVFVSPTAINIALGVDDEDHINSWSQFLEEFILPVSDIVNCAWENDLPIRGSISFGDIIFKNDSSLLLGNALIRAAKWESEQDWAWISLDPNSKRVLDNMEGAPQGMLIGDVPTKGGSINTYFIDPEILSSKFRNAIADFQMTFNDGTVKNMSMLGSGGDEGANKLADITLSSYLLLDAHNLKDIAIKCINTLRLLDENAVGAANLTREVADRNSLAWVTDDIKVVVKISEQKDLKQNVIDEFRSIVNSFCDKLGSNDFSFTSDGCQCNFIVNLSGSPHRLTDSLHGLIDGPESLRKLNISVNLCAYSTANEDQKLMNITTGPPIESGDVAAWHLTFNEERYASNEMVMVMAHQCAMNGKLDLTLKAYEEIDKRLPDEGGKLLEYASSVRQIEDIESIKSEYNIDIDEWWADGEHWYNRSVIYLSLGKNLQAVEAAVVAALLKPSNADAWSQVGCSLMVCGYPKDSLDWHKRSIAMRPDFHKYYFHLGQALMACGKRKEAADSYKRAIKCKNDYWQAILNLFYCSLGVSDEESRKQLDALRELGSGRPETLFAGILYNHTTGDHSGALKLIEEIQNSGELNHDILNIELHSLIEVGKAEQACIRITHELERGRTNVDILLLYAQALLSIEKASEAMHILSTQVFDNIKSLEYILIKELAERILNDWDKPIAESKKRTLINPRTVLCFKTIESAAKYGIEHAFKVGNGI